MCTRNSQERLTDATAVRKNDVDVCFVLADRNPSRGPQPRVDDIIQWVAHLVGEPEKCALGGLGIPVDC